MTEQPTPRTEAGRRMLADPMYRHAIGHVLAIEAQARTEALGRVRALKAKYEYSRDEATLAGIPSAASDFAAAVEACAEVLAILTQARTEALDVEALARAVVAEATCERWGDLHSIRWASDTFAAFVVERYRGTLPPEFDCQPAKETP